MTPIGPVLVGLGLVRIGTWTGRTGVAHIVWLRPDMRYLVACSGVRDPESIIVKDGAPTCLWCIAESET